MMQSVNNQISIKKDVIAADGRNSSLKQSGSDFIAILSELYSASQEGENSSLRAVYNSIQQIRDKNEGYAGGVDVSRYSSVTKPSDGNSRRQKETVLSGNDRSCNSRENTEPQTVRPDLVKKSQSRTERSGVITKAETDTSGKDAENKVLNDDYAARICADNNDSAGGSSEDYAGTQSVFDSATDGFIDITFGANTTEEPNVESPVITSKTENEKLLLKTLSDPFAQFVLPQGENEEMLSSSEQLLSSGVGEDSILNGGDRLTQLITKQIIPDNDASQSQQSAEKMTMVSDESLDADLDRIVAALESEADQNRIDAVKSSDTMTKLVQSAGVTSVTLHNADADIDVESQLFSLEELQNIDDSLKLAKSIKTHTDRDPSSQENGHQADSSDSQYGNALKTLRSVVGQFSETSGSGDLSKGILNGTLSERIPAAEQNGVNETRLFGSNNLLFAQGAAREINSSLMGNKEPSLNDLMSLSSDIRKNAEEITKKVMEMAARNLRQMELNLNPESLGKMRISIDLTGASEITKITVSASEPATRELIAQTLGRLREQFEISGSEVETDLAEYHEQSDDAEFAQQNERSEKDERQDETIFASDDSDSVEKEIVDETQINSQNDERVSYFA